MIEVKNLIKDHGSLRVLDGVSLSVRRGEVATVIGPSGGGKSTLLRCINGLETFQAGEVQVDQVRLTAGAASSGAVEHCRRSAVASAWCSSNSICFRIGTCCKTCSRAPCMCSINARNSRTECEAAA